VSFASIALLGLALAPADLSDPELVAVLPVEGAEMTEARSDLVRQTVRTALESENLMLIRDEHVGSAMAARASDCAAQASCRSELAEELRTRFLVRVIVDEPKASDFDVRVEVYEPASSTTISSFAETCTICSEADLKRIVQESSLDARLSLERHLVPAAEDPKPTLVAPVEPLLTPPSPQVEVRMAKTSPLTLAGWGLVGAGAAATVGGIVLLGLQGSNAGCPDDPRGGECLPLVYRTVIPGSVTLVSGVVLAATGVGLVFVGRKQAEKRAATARLVPTGNGLLVTGRF
jgi:hypothetical protein